MKPHIYIRILLACCLFAAVPAFAGNIYLTGHDLDFHCANQAPPTQCNAFGIAVALARAGAPDPSKPVLFVDQPNTTEFYYGQQQTALAAANVVPPLVSGTDYIVVDPTTSGWTAATLSTNSYSAILFASYINCGGCDNTEAAVTAINGRTADILAFFNSGGGLVYLSGGYGSTSYYDSVPSSVAVNKIPTCDEGLGCYTVTPLGSALGLTSDDASCCATHNSFSPPAAGSTLQIAETDGNGNPETLYATSGTQQPPPTNGPSTAILPISAGSNTATAIFTSLSGTQHSFRISFPTPNTSFSVPVRFVPRTDGEGNCDGTPASATFGNTGSDADIDCQFPPFYQFPTSPSTTGPTPVPYANGTISGNVGAVAGYYDIPVSPDPNAYGNTAVDGYITFPTPSSSLPATCPGGGNDFRVMDSPSFFPFGSTMVNNEWILDETSFVKLGDGGGGFKTRPPNRYLLVDDGIFITNTYKKLLPPNNWKVEPGIPVLFVFQVRQPNGHIVSNAATPPYSVGMSLSNSSGALLPIVPFPGTPSTFQFIGWPVNAYFFVISTTGMAKDTYQLNINSVFPPSSIPTNPTMLHPLFCQQSFAFTLADTDHDGD